MRPDPAIVRTYWDTAEGRFRGSSDRLPLWRRAAPLHRCSNLDELQQGVVVLGITDSHRVVWRQAKHVERDLQPRRLAHPLGQHHDAAAIEGQDEAATPSAG